VVPQGSTGRVLILRRYVRPMRPARGRVYQEVPYQPGQAMQVDGGECGRVQVGSTRRTVSVFVAVLCSSRLLTIEFTLSQRQAEGYRGLVNALTFFGGRPRPLIFDNLKAAVRNGAGRSACFHPALLALCGYVCLQPVACARRDPESKGVVEGGVPYVKHNALAGRADERTRFEDYLTLAPSYDAASVEKLLLAERRRRQLPTPTLPTPQRRQLIDDIDLEPADPALYDRFGHDTEEDSPGTT
jgi:transposase